MSRKDFKTGNIPIELSDWIDAAIRAHRGKRSDTLDLPLMLGIQSRDEYIRLAVAILILATQPERDGKTPLGVVQDLVRRLERARKAEEARGGRPPDS